VGLLPKIQLNIVLSDHNVDKDGRDDSQGHSDGAGGGDSIIFVYPVEDVIRADWRRREALMYESR